MDTGTAHPIRTRHGMAMMFSAVLAVAMAGGGFGARPSGIASAAEPFPNCRFGITTLTGVSGYDLTSLAVGSYLNWGMTASPVGFPGVEYVQVVRLRDAERRFVLDPAAAQSWADLQASVLAVAAANPGSAWLVGNEPDTTYENQDGVTPEQYAEAYHAIHAVIRAADPAARIGIGTIVQPTPLRLQWLDLMWSAYRTRYGASPASDFWSIHSFILREERGGWGTGIPPGAEFAGVNQGVLYEPEQTDRIDYFRQRIVDFRAWMAGKGERNKPLWITEYGSLMPHDPSHGYYTFPITRTRDYMLATFDYLRTAQDSGTGYTYDGNRLVQAWFWYSLNDYQWKMGGGLFDPENGNQRTLLGDAWVSYVTGISPSPDLGLYDLALTAQFPAAGASPITYRVTGVLSNSGNVPAAPGAETTAGVRGSGEAEFTPAASASTTTGLRGCGAFQTIDLSWSEDAIRGGTARISVAAAPGSADADTGNNSVDLPLYPYTDIDVSFGRDAIVEVTSRGVMAPPAPTTFNTQGIITRETMATFMANAYAASTGAPAPVVEVPFSDIAGLPQSTREDIARIYGLGITTGTTTTTYTPDLMITRNQMAVFLARLYKSIHGSDAPTVDTPFVDISAEPWAVEGISRIYGLGITKGATATEYRPYALVTREQMALFIVRLLRSAGK